MKLKKIAMAVILGASLMLTGCGSSGDDSVSTNSSAKSAVDKIKEAGVLKVGVKVDVPKFGYKNTKTNEVEGFEVDLSKAISKKILGEEKIETTGVNAKTRGPLLDNGEVDIDICTFTITEERKKSYLFSDSYYTDAVGLLVKKDSGIKSLKDLDGKTVGVAQSSTTKDAITAEADKLGIKVNYSEFGSYPEIKAALDSGRVDCFSVDGAILNGYVDDTTEILDDKFNPQEYGVCIKKGNDDLLEVVNEVINEMKDSGELDELIDKWGIK